jgi:hypothetical protein
MKRFLTAVAVSGLGLAAALGAATAGAPVRVQGICLDSQLLPQFDLNAPRYNTCAQHPQTSFHFDSDGVGTQYGLQVTTPREHCSKIQYQAWIGDRMLGKGTFMGPGETQFIPLGNSFPRGYHRFDIRVIGEVGGCNQGRMHSWAAFVSVVIIP